LGSILGSLGERQHFQLGNWPRRCSSECPHEDVMMGP
jgi:hypothetical protein